MLDGTLLGRLQSLEISNTKVEKKKKRQYLRARQLRVDTKTQPYIEEEQAEQKTGRGGGEERWRRHWRMPDGEGEGRGWGEEAEAAGPFPAQLLKWMALGGRWRGSKESPSTPLEKGMPLTLKWASVSTSGGES